MSENEGEAPQEAPRGAAAAAVLAAASRAKADEYLDTQIHLAHMQAERETREERLRDRSQFVRHISDLLKLAFEFVVALIVIAIAAALGAAVVSAINDRGAVVEAFSVPPDLESRGLTGEVVAGKVIDRLAALQNQTQSNRAGSSFVNNWGNDIKVQIPETGVSIGQIYRYLCQWLGHETHISGEIYRDDKGLAVTARVGAQSATLHGTDGKLDDLIGRAAEAVYRTTQPYRYAVYLSGQGRTAEADTIYRQLIATGSREDRAWSYIGLSAEYAAKADYAGARRVLLRAVAINPNLLLPYINIANNDGQLQHDEDQLAFTRKAVALEQRGPDRSMNAMDFSAHAIMDPANLALMLGDTPTALALTRKALARPDIGVYAVPLRQQVVVMCAALHDRGCVADALSEFPPDANPIVAVSRLAIAQQADFFLEDWHAAIDKAAKILPVLDGLGPIGKIVGDRAEKPGLALAYANVGDFRMAHTLIDPSPLDCVLCLRVRGRVAALAHDWAASERWYRRAIAAAPSVPVVYGDFGQSLLDKGDIDGAIAQFEAAMKRGPNQHDVLELYGEALIARNRSDLALDKFRAALPLAPKWGRLHLKYAQALLYTGHKDAAKAEFALAATLDLTPAERAQLPR